eukprot:scaffold318540_cov19-Tisochrysis_lutea.AAC.3
MDKTKCFLNSTPSSGSSLWWVLDRPQKALSHSSIKTGFCYLGIPKHASKRSSKAYNNYSSPAIAKYHTCSLSRHVSGRAASRLRHVQAGNLAPFLQICNQYTWKRALMQPLLNGPAEMVTQETGKKA